MSWHSDGTITGGGFHICASTSQQVLWNVIEGGEYCQLTNGNTCITDGTGDYGTNGLSDQEP